MCPYSGQLKSVGARLRAAKKAFKLTFLSIMLIPLSSNAKEFSTEDFAGEWCGKWDQTFEFCIEIDNLDKKAKYRWKEHPDGHFKKTTKSIKRMNWNTLKLDNIWLILDQKTVNHAQAFGVFDLQSRVSKINKSVATEK